MAHGIALVISNMRRGGRERVALDVVRGVDSARFRAFVVVMKDGDLLADLPSDQAYPRLARFKGDLLGYAWRLWRILRRERPAVLLCVGNRWDSVVARLLAHPAGVRVTILELHGAVRADAPPLTRFDRWLKPFTAHYIAIGEQMQTYLTTRGGIAPQQVTLIPNGVETSRFTPLDEAARAAARWRAWGLAPDVPVLGCVAGLRPEKNHTLLLDAFARLRTRLPTARLMLVGDGTERPALERQSAALGLGEAVQWLGQRADVADLMPLFNLHVLASHTEVAPLVILEAGACGVPSVATRVGGVPDLIQHGETGWLTPPGDPDALAEALHHLLTEADTRRRLGATAQQTVRERYSLSASLAAREALFMRLIDQHDPYMGRG